MKSQPTSRPGYHRANLSSVTRLAALLALVALIAIPLFSSSLASSISEASGALPVPRTVSDKSAAINPNIFGSFLHAGKQLALLPASPQGSESIAIFAADCTTAKTAFALGETICAKTDGVDLSVPGNYYVNWFHPDSSETNGGTITQNPQYFLFALPTSGTEVGTWKVNIGRVTPAETSIIGNPPLFTVSQGPAISTFAYDSNLQTCTTTPKTNFLLGETVCATASGVGAQFNRRFAWVGPGGITRQFTAITTDPQTDSFTLPSTDTSTINGEVFDNRGTWQARVVSARGSGIVATPFTAAAATPSVNLSIAKGLTSGELKSGEDATFSISAYNRGPNDAANVKITDVTPANATFVSATPTAGSGFSCTGTATVTCTAAIMKPGQQVTVDIVYTPGTAGQSITNTATVESDTQELDNDDNSATAGPYTIGQGNGGGGNCTVACPDDITTPANTVDGQNNSGAIVHFSPPSGNEECGTIAVDHCNDCFFPEGSTVVTATATSGETCSFTVTITPAGSSPTISCPGNKSGNADGTCQATFSLGTATASGQNVTLVAYRSDGKPVYTCDAFGNCTRNGSDAPFSAGTATVTWYAYAHDVPGPYTGPVDGNGDPVNQSDTEEGHRTGSSTCVQSVTVNDVTPPTINATDQTVAADANCQAAVPDYSNSASDNCACASSDTSEICNERQDIVVAQDVPAGTLLGPGSYSIHLTANDGSSNNNGAGNTTNKTITFTVADQTPPAIICPAPIVRSTDPGLCSATVNPGTASASDNCDTTPTIVGTRSDNQPLNAPYPKGTTTIHWTATDDANNTSFCDQTVTVNDTEPPVISCQADIVADFDPAVNGAVVNYTTPVGTDNCPSNTVQTAGLPTGSIFPAGTTTNTFTVTDGSGNTASCSFKVTVAITSIIGLDSDTLSGNVIVDSYNSSIGYPASKGSLANLLSNGTISISGSSKMFGNVRSTRVGVSVQGTSQVNGNATAGTTVSKGASAIITGTITNNALAPVMTLPSVAACGPPYSPNSGITGTYSYNSTTGDLTLSGVNIATLANGGYCFHNVSLSNSGQLKVNGPVTIKLTGTLSIAGASTLNNTTQIPSNLRILSSYSGSNGVTFGNGSAVYMLVYAPQTNVSDTGSAPVYGTVVGKTITVSNSGMIHYDTQLKTFWPTLWTLILTP